MADTDEASVAFAREAAEAAQRVQRDAAALRPLLSDLGYENERRVLDEFDTRFAEYRALDRDILDLAVLNTSRRSVCRSVLLRKRRMRFGIASRRLSPLRPRTAGSSGRSSRRPRRTCVRSRHRTLPSPMTV